MGQFASDFEEGKAGIAYRGEANDVWHRLGASRKNDQTTKEEWLRDSTTNIETRRTQMTRQDHINKRYTIAVDNGETSEDINICNSKAIAFGVFDTQCGEPNVFSVRLIDNKTGTTLKYFERHIGECISA